MMTDDRVLRMLTIRPTDLARWTKVCNRVNKQIAIAHPEYPHLNDMQLLSHVKRLLPEIRAMVVAMDKEAEKVRST